MYKLLLSFGLILLFAAQINAEMKCAPGKCGSGMKQDTKQDKKYVLKGNTVHKAIDIQAKEYSCSKCNMLVNKLDYAAQAVKKNGDTYFFDDIGCMIQWLEKSADNVVKRYVKTLDTHQWIEVEKAHYSRIAPSPMGYGFGAIEASKEGLISYPEVKKYMLSGETLRNPAVKKALLGE